MRRLAAWVPVRAVLAAIFAVSAHFEGPIWLFWVFVFAVSYSGRDAVMFQLAHRGISHPVDWHRVQEVAHSSRCFAAQGMQVWCGQRRMGQQGSTTASTTPSGRRLRGPHVCWKMIASMNSKVLLPECAPPPHAGPRNIETGRAGAQVRRAAAHSTHYAVCAPYDRPSTLQGDFAAMRKSLRAKIAVRIDTEQRCCASIDLPASASTTLPASAKGATIEIKWL
jgi:hypothetical protein